MPSPAVTLTLQNFHVEINTTRIARYLCGSCKAFCSAVLFTSPSHFTASGGSSLMWMRGKRVPPGYHRGGKSRKNKLICLLVSVTLYSALYIGFGKTFSGLLWQEATKTMFAIKTTRVVVYMYNFLCAYSSHKQYTRWMKLKCWAKGAVPNYRAYGSGPLPPEPPLFTAAWSIYQ